MRAIGVSGVFEPHLSNRSPPKEGIDHQSAWYGPKGTADATILPLLSVLQLASACNSVCIGLLAGQYLTELAIIESRDLSTDNHQSGGQRMSNSRLWAA